MEKDFVTAVREMRKYQKRYFRTKDANDYVKARELERQVDDMLSKMNGQEELFG
ncbi:MAG: hypothetical protein IJT52_04975 [Spirochaetales bacterium]|nr:hypothetical protein [Spirochaetales bacterium]